MRTSRARHVASQNMWCLITGMRFHGIKFPKKTLEGRCFYDWEYDRVCWCPSPGQLLLGLAAVKWRASVHLVRHQRQAKVCFFTRSLPTLVLSFLHCRLSTACFGATICFGNATLLFHSLICCTNDGEQLENSVHPLFRFWTTFTTLLFSIACRERAWRDFGLLAYSGRRVLGLGFDLCPFTSVSGYGTSMCCYFVLFFILGASARFL